MILAIQRDDKIALFTRNGEVDTDVEVLSIDEAERFAKAVLAIVPRARETSKKNTRQRLTATLNDLELQRNSIKSELGKL